MNRVPFWNSLLNKDFVTNREVILGCEFDLFLGCAEVWGSKIVLDALESFFINAFVQNDLLDISPIKLSPTWRNKRTGENRVSKRLDRFLVVDRLVLECYLVRQWVDCGGESDHCPIFFEIQGRSRKPPSPFKFNHKWLKEPSFCKLVQDLWIPISIGTKDLYGVLFMENISRVKQATITWAHAK